MVLSMLGTWFENQHFYTLIYLSIFLWTEIFETQKNQNIEQILLIFIRIWCKKWKGENLGTGILYFPDFLHQVTRACKRGEFLPCERMFVCQLKLAGDKFPTIREKFMKRFWKMTPCRSAIKAMAKRWAHDSHGYNMGPES